MKTEEPSITVLTPEVNQKQQVSFEDLGTIDYKSAWDYQEKLFDQVVQNKLEQRKKPSTDFIQEHHLLFCEHNHVYTLGKSGSMKNLLINQDVMNERHISFFKINRGGDITYHGPGQIVGYPILDLDYFFTDIGKYLRLIEEAVILTLKDYGIEASRSPGETGVWLEPQSPSRSRKICAIGVRCSRWRQKAKPSWSTGLLSLLMMSEVLVPMSCVTGSGLRMKPKRRMSPPIRSSAKLLAR